MFLSVSVGERTKNPLESWSPIMVLGRKVGTAEERTAIRSKKCRERPAALPAHGLYGCLITAVHIRTLVAIHLHGDEVIVDQLGDRKILVRLAVHHMAPVAPHRADVEQHRLVRALRFFEGISAPFVPLHRLMHGR